MPSIVEILSSDPEPYPDWLQENPYPFCRSHFFGSRTLFYPGSGNDGQPVKLCARAHAVHAFIYADYGAGKDTLLGWLKDPDTEFRGYNIIGKQSIAKCELVPDGWEPHVNLSELPNNLYSFVDSSFEPFALYVVFERDKGYDENHGPTRLAGLFIGGDGFATFDALYCQDAGIKAPHLILIQDHGFGGQDPNLTWGRDNSSGISRIGLFDRIATECSKKPNWLLVGKPTIPWDGYSKVNADADLGGEHGIPRYLYQLNSLEGGT